MHETLALSHHPQATDLQALAGIVFAALGVTGVEKRFSSNYPPDEHYFLGFGTNASVTVCDADDVDGSDYPYWLVIQGPVPWGDAVDELPVDPRVVADVLQKAGFQTKLSLD